MAQLTSVTKMKFPIAGTLAVFVGGLLLGAGIAVLIEMQYAAPKTQALRESDFPTATSDYKFIDPLIGIRGVSDTARYAGMQKEVATYIASQEQRGLTIASVDFRDINQPGGFLVNPAELYTPASLNKVPVMMTFYKLAETDPAILSQAIIYSGATNSNSVEEITSAVQLTPGTSYTVEQLIEHMIRNSDNNAADLLSEYLAHSQNLGAYNDVLSNLGLDPKVIASVSESMTVQDYSIFLRALYNATYLDRSDSEHALKLLSETDFTSGLEAGVPNSIPVAEKFGEVRMVGSSGSLIGKQVNNCGIVYYPQHPYLLCIMTKGAGDNVAYLESVIATISKMVYNDMQHLYP